MQSVFIMVLWNVLLRPECPPSLSIRIAILGQIHCPLSTESCLCQDWVVDSYRRPQKQDRNDMRNPLLYYTLFALPQFLQAAAEELPWLKEVSMLFFLDAGMYEAVRLQRIWSFILFTNRKKQIVGSLVAHCTQGICKNKNAQIRGGNQRLLERSK